MQNVAIFALPRHDETTVGANRYVGFALIGATGSVNVRIAVTIRHDISHIVEDKIGDFRRVDAENVARLFHRHGRLINVIVSRSNVFVSASLGTLNDNVRIDVARGDFRRVRRGGNKERVLIRQSARASEGDAELIRRARDGFDDDFDRADRRLHRAVRLVGKVRASRIVGILEAVSLLVVFVSASNRRIKRRLLRNFIEGVLDILSRLIRIGVDDDTGLLSLAIIGSDRLDVVDGRNHAARQIIDERIARDLQRLEHRLAPLRTNHLRDRLRVVRAKEILQAQFLERGAILKIADVE